MFEIERKFLLKPGREWAPFVTESHRIAQGYVTGGGATNTVRVRILDAEAFLTIKGPTSGIRRLEFEYRIPVQDAKTMLAELCGGQTIDKTRHHVMVGDLLWTIDEFHGSHEGLLLAEVELTDEKTQIELPHWASREVSDDPRYFNANLIGAPTPPKD